MRYKRSSKKHKKLMIIFIINIILCLNVSIIQVEAASTKMEKAIQWAIGIANDNSHGYSQTNRLGPDYDCSSYVGAALAYAGFSGTSGFNTRTMGSILESKGFTRYTYSSVSSLQRGDIMWRSGHTEIYLGNNQLIGAHHDYGHPATGDQTGQEISVNRFNGSWTYYYRYNGLDDDIQAPSITNYGVKDVTKDGYTVYCTVTDNVGVTDVKFPTNYAGGALTLLEATSKSGNTYYCNVKTNNEGIYNTFIRAYDAAGNKTEVWAADKYIDRTPPVISNIRITNKSAAGYRIYCTVTDNDKLNRVQFPTWTEANGQDDILADWTTSSKVAGIKSGNEYYFDVKYSDHSNEQGKYITYITAYDDYGNWSEYKMPAESYYRYTVSYNANGGTGAPSSQTAVNGISFTISKTIPTRTGYAFNGWSKKSNATTADYWPENNLTVSGNMTLYAIWVKTSTANYYVKGDVNGDGIINTIDLTKIMKHMVGKITLDSKQFAAADINNDGQISLVDMARVQKYLIGKLDTLE